MIEKLLNNRKSLENKDDKDSIKIESDSLNETDNVPNIVEDEAKTEKASALLDADLSEDISQQLENLFKSGVKILTADGGFLHRPREQQEIMALYDNGVFLVSKSHISDPYVLKLESYARLKDVKIRRKIPVSLEVIRDAYRYFEATSKSKLDTVASGKMTDMQKDIVNLIQAAVDDDASDIHVVCSDVSAIVEMRKNGVLKQQLEWQATYGHNFCAACFAMADASDSNYNPTEYQAARISGTTAELPVQVTALRLQFNPLAYGGRYMIIRLLYSSKNADKTDGVSKLGYHPYQIELLEKMSKKTVGICIISGPTGSGKSTTLFQILNKVMKDCNYERNVLTIEDPPERPIFGAKQMPVTNASTQEERNAKFIQAISASMRSDPDTIMIGEVRDNASADLAIEAAITGHQVWTTIHANDAFMILNRLRNIGVPEHNLYTPGVIFGLVAQRLARKSCPTCKIPYAEAVKKGMVEEGLQQRIKESLTEEQISKIFMPGSGCKTCGEGKGYVGRTVVAEVIFIDEKFLSFIKDDNISEAKKYWVEELKGMTMLTHGVLKTISGEISPTEVERVVGAIELDKNIKLEEFE